MQYLPQVNKDPLVSIIVRTVDRPYYLKECISSILVQDYSNLEIIVINDGGPSIKYLIDEFKTQRPIILHELNENQGRSYCGNLGLEKINGRFACFIDDDDIFYPFHISTLAKAIIKSNYKVVYSDALQATQVRCSYNDKMYTTVDLNLVLSEEFSYRDLLTRNFIPILCAMFDRRCIDEGAKFDINMEVLEDWDFWLQIAAKYDFLHIPELTCEYRFRKDGSNTVGQLDHLWEWSRKYIKEKYGHLLLEKTPYIQDNNSL